MCIEILLPVVRDIFIVIGDIAVVFFVVAAFVVVVGGVGGGGVNVVVMNQPCAALYCLPA